MLITILKISLEGRVPLHHSQFLYFPPFLPPQEAKQRSLTLGSGENATDLVSYVEFQRNCSVLMKAHYEALVSTVSRVGTTQEIRSSFQINVSEIILLYSNVVFKP